MDFFEGKKVVKVCAGPDFNYALTSVNIYFLCSELYRMEKYILGEIMIMVNWEILPNLLMILLMKLGIWVVLRYLIISGIGEAKIVDIVAGETFGAAVSDNGKLFTWGFGNVS
jgi:hypothetical protein